MKTILIIDDNAYDLDLAKDILEFSGYATLSATDAATGIQLMKEQNPDLVLLDLFMPMMDGFEAFEIIKSDTRLQKTPVLAYTGHASELTRAVSSGFKDIIIKPTEVAHFLKIIEANLAA